MSLNYQNLSIEVSGLSNCQIYFMKNMNNDACLLTDISSRPMVNCTMPIDQYIGPIDFKENILFRQMEVTAKFLRKKARA